MRGGGEAELNTPAENRARIDFARASRTPGVNSGSYRSKQVEEATSKGGKRLLGGAGAGVQTQGGVRLG